MPGSSSRCGGILPGPIYMSELVSRPSLSDSKTKRPSDITLGWQRRQASLGARSDNDNGRESRGMIRVPTAVLRPALW
jgi:hypothetical protein